MDLDAFLTTAGELLTMPSTADRPDELRRALDFVIDFVGPGFTVERFESGGKPSALLHHSPGPFRVVLNAHLDVVPAEPAQFEPRRVGDRLYARGAQDMKVTALAQAMAFRELAARLPYPLALQLVTDEEVGGRNGTDFQLSHGVSAGFVIIGEHSGLDIVADSKGVLQVRLLAAGRGGHGAYPWLGDNALLMLLRTISRLLEVYPPAAAPAWRTTVNVARIDTTNRAFNQIPARAEAWLDIRFPAEDPDLGGKTEAEVRDYLLRFGEPGVRVDIDHVDPAHHADHERLEIKELRRAAREQGYAGAFLYKHGAGDGRFYARRGIDAVAFGVGGDGQHGSDEYVDVTTIVPYYRALTSFLHHLASA